MSSRPILVGYDGSEGARLALDWALNEAGRTSEPVQVAYAFEWMTASAWIGPGPGPGTWPDERTRSEVEAVVATAVTEAADTHPGVTVRGEVLDNPAAIGLQQRSARAALVVLGSRGHGGFTGLLAGSTTVAVCAHAHCPVVVVRHPVGVGPGVGAATDQSRIVVGVDGSPCAQLALGWAVERAASRSAPLHAIRAWIAPGAPWRPADMDPAEVSRAELAALDEQLAGWRDRYPAVSITTEVVVANPAGALVEASENAQLVVVGTRGRGGFRGLLLGSVSQQLLHHAQCPVAVIRELRHDLDHPTEADHAPDAGADADEPVTES